MFLQNFGILALFVFGALFHTHALEFSDIARKDERCNGPGADPLRNQFSTNNCACKRYARGRFCTKCKKNSFNLRPDHPDGCLKCFCSGRTNKCQSANMYQKQVSYIPGHLDLQLVVKRDHDQMHSTNLSFVDPNNLGAEFSEPLYSKVSPSQEVISLQSYGGVLAYQLSYELHAGVNPQSRNGPTVVMKGNGITLTYRSTFEDSPDGTGWFVVPLWEQHWSMTSQRKCKRACCRKSRRAKRKHFMKVLADVQELYIKTAPKQGTKKIRMKELWVTEASRDSTVGQQIPQIERCSCPVGYSGLSCQFCSKGYKKSMSPKSVLGFDCVPCECNGNSDVCEQDTGYCLLCGNDSTGRYCEKKILHCNASGSLSQNGTLMKNEQRCLCKSRVTGVLCDECRRGYFALDQTNQHGCHKCWCNEVTSECRSSALTRVTYPVHANFINLQDVQGLKRAIPTIQGRATYQMRSGIGALRWLLPKRVTGNLLESYGGELTFTIENTGHCPSETHLEPFVKLEAHSGKSINWKFDPKILLNRTQSYTISLNEDSFHYMSRQISRNFFLQILSSIKNIYVYTPRCSQMTSINIQDLVLDVAVEGGLMQPLALDVEHCQCPTGYAGLSCENCADGYTIDSGDRCIKETQ